MELLQSCSQPLIWSTVIVPSRFAWLIPVLFRVAYLAAWSSNEYNIAHEIYKCFRMVSYWWFRIATLALGQLYLCNPPSASDVILEGPVKDMNKTDCQQTITNHRLAWPVGILLGMYCVCSCKCPHIVYLTHIMVNAEAYGRLYCHLKSMPFSYPHTAWYICKWCLHISLSNNVGYEATF